MAAARNWPSLLPSARQAKRSSVNTWRSGSTATVTYRCCSISGLLSSVGNCDRESSCAPPRSCVRKVLAMPVIVGRKTANERFAGAENTMPCEGIMRDGKALQMATSHEFGQRFSRAFNITYSSAEGSTELCWTTSWGATTRMVGGLIMCHGDDFGLVLPPTVAPVQAVVVVVKDTDGGVARTASVLVEHLKRLGDGVDQGFGWRATEWDLQGVPIRVEIGPRDVVDDAAVLYRRDTREKTK